MATIFISYAHRDDVALSFDKEGWISRLHRDLATWAGTQPEPKPDVWIDRKRLDAGALFGNVINDELDRAELLLPVVSPDWNGSKDCKDEWKRFWDRTAGSQTRIIPVVFSYSFEQVYQLDPPFGEINYKRELRYEVAMEKDEYSRFLGALIREIQSRLDRLPQRQLASPNGPQKHRVFVAHAVGEVAREMRSTLIKELDSRGFAIEDGKVNDEDSAEEILSRVKRTVPGCLACVHFFGQRWGPIPDENGDDRRTAIQLQFDAIEGFERKPKVQVAWSDRGFAPSDKDASDKDASKDSARNDFLRRVKNILGTDYWKTDPADFVSGFLKRLEQALKAPPPPFNPSAVYLLFDSKDWEAGAIIRRYIETEHRQPVIVLPKKGADEAEYLSLHNYFLRHAKWLYIYHGSVEFAWSDYKQAEIFKARDLEGLDNMDGVVCLGPKEDINKSVFGSPFFAIARRYGDQYGGTFTAEGTWPPAAVRAELQQAQMAKTAST